LELPKPPALMRPMDYTRLERLQCIYEGDLHGLKERFMREPSLTPGAV
jgi:hypothetical protein